MSQPHQKCTPTVCLQYFWGSFVAALSLQLCGSDLAPEKCLALNGWQTAQHLWASYMIPVLYSAGEHHTVHLPGMVLGSKAALVPWALAVQQSAMQHGILKLAR